MEARQKMPLGLTTDSLPFKQTIKASSSEIIKDLLQMNQSAALLRKPNSDLEFRKNKGSKNSCGRKGRIKITEDIGAVLGLATLINEMNDSACGFMKSEPAEEKRVVKILKNKKTANGKAKLFGFTRAGTHLAIAFLIKQKMTRTKCVNNVK